MTIAVDLGRKATKQTNKQKHVFSCISNSRVPRMLFEHEANRLSVEHHPRDPASVNAMKQTCVIVILAYFYLIPAQLALKTLRKH